MWRWSAVAFAALAGVPAVHAEPGLKPCTVQGISARCGTIAVPESRARPDGQTIRLNVVVVRALHRPAAPDAFTFIAGGPGGAATHEVSWVVPLFGAVNDRRDMLFVDQRGTGASHPLLCPLPRHQLKSDGQKRAYANRCLRSVHADVAQFGTRAAMDDLDAVRAALGYRQLDVYGASYGATAAQVFLKRHPASVRTLTLDGATELDVPFFSRFALGAQAALADVAARCSAGAGCRAVFPGWRAQFTRLVRAWNNRPVATRKGESIDGNDLASIVQSMLLSASSAAEIPLLVSRAAHRDYRLLNRRIRSGSPNLDLMFYSVWCSEPWVGLDARGPWHTDFDGYAARSIAQHRAICAWLPKRPEPAPAWTLPRSTVPVLLLAGGADPQDPLANFPRFAAAFANGRAIVVPHYGHTVAQYGCLGALVSRFVIAGSAKHVDARCVRAIEPPSFFVR